MAHCSVCRRPSSRSAQNNSICCKPCLIMPAFPLRHTVTPPLALKITTLKNVPERPRASPVERNGSVVPA
ncbi:hypothetical protein DOTSEDRAFT_71244 [Dothistroma septosporum NZE10]|uniref:Uncharacterized protein n=1 Tax=Dothistroma septosporum (strain NZE10 / CBS 128990) TaxID=675120 RepID=N1PPZ1_DOTSN|nr:hypothetical protein DOTSEDRAFT_71244 [Dothistroma septosporum NZE10]